MAISVTIETTIAREPDEVFAALTDLERWPTWLIATGIRSVQRTEGGPLTVGERVTVDQSAAGRSSTVEATIVALDPGARFLIEGRDGDGVSTSLEAVLARVEEGTRLRWSARIELPLRLRVFEGLARPSVERAAALDVEAFRRRLESSPTA